MAEPQEIPESDILSSFLIHFKTFMLDAGYGFIGYRLQVLLETPCAQTTTN